MFGRRIMQLGGLLALSLMLSGCSRLSKSSKEATETIESSTDEVIAQITLDKSVYRPGEAILAQVTVLNTTNQTLRVRVLDAFSGPPENAEGSVSFWFGPENSQRRTQRFPVISRVELQNRRENAEKTVEIAPQQTITRPFLLTRFTTEPGRFVAQVHITPFWQSDPLAQRVGKVFSNSVPYTVYGDILFDRDSRGLVYLEEAINLAAATTPGDIMLTDAMLIEDEMGFYKWWVNVDYRDPSGEMRKIAYLVDPYQGRVWSKARQFDPAAHPRNRNQPRSTDIPTRQPGVLRGPANP